MRFFRVAAFALSTAILSGNPASAQPTLEVRKSESCGCCKLWVGYMQSKGFQTRVINMEPDALYGYKAGRGIKQETASCHTAEIGGYLIEGHVPVEDVQRLLAEKPDALGLSVPGMPLGSPGMEVPSGKPEPYQTLLIHKDGSTSVYARHN